MSDETIKVTITVIGSIMVAVVAGWFGRQPKVTKAATAADGTPLPPPGTDPALLVWVQRVVDERITDALKQRDAAIDRADKAEARADEAETKVRQLEQEIIKLQGRVASLEAELGRTPESRTRMDDRGVE